MPHEPHMPASLSITRCATAMRGVARLLRALHLDPLTPELAEFAGDVHRDLVAAGKARSDFDTIIAAHAM